MTTSRFPFMTQGKDSCCALVAVLNAARYWGVCTPEVGSDGWQELVDLAKCSAGPALGYGLTKVADIFGLEISRISVFETTLHAKLPVMANVINPEPKGGGLHTILIVGFQNGTPILVNYRGLYGNVVEVVCPEWADMPNDKFYTIRPKEHNTPEL